MSCNNQLFISVLPHETRIVQVENHKPCEYAVEFTRYRSVVGNIVLGKILRVVPGMQSVFVDIGLEKAGFLHVSDVLTVRQGLSQEPIERLFYAGQIILVQIIKAPMGAKGARLSTSIAITGRWLVFLPYQTGVHLSQKIRDEATRARLKAQVEELTKESNWSGGMIVRTNAEECEKAELEADGQFLAKIWEDVLKKIEGLRRQPSFKPSVVYEDTILYQRVIRDWVNEHTQAIHVDDRSVYDGILSFSQKFGLNLKDRLFLHAHERPIFQYYQIDQELANALNKRVNLSSGGYLMIEQTEAMTVIDVNTGRYLGRDNFEETIYKTNLEAAQTIAQQLRLRNVGGIIMIDFIDMVSAAHRSGVLETLKACLSRDRTKIYLGTFSQLGLVEMTRKRTDTSLTNQSFNVCEACKGTGLIPDAQTITYEILRELVMQSKQFNNERFEVRCSPAVQQLLLGDDELFLKQLMEQSGREVVVLADAAYHVDQYDIVLF